MARSLRDRTFGRMGSDGLDDEFTVERIAYMGNQQRELKENIGEYKKQVTDVAVAIADHQLSNNMIKGESVNLKDVIPRIKLAYDNAYTNDHWALTKWIKSWFTKSDRAQEINFLDQISKHPDCTEFIRLQAACLVRDKIYQTEMFGNWFGGGSKLGRLLDGVVGKGKFTIDTNTHENLVDFIKTKGLSNQMPKSLKEYLAQTGITDEFKKDAEHTYQKR
jgi:hypothetical protein